MNERCHRCNDSASKFYEMIDGEILPICEAHAKIVEPGSLCEKAPVGECRMCGAEDVYLTGLRTIVSSRRDPYDERICEDCRIFGEEDRLKAQAYREARERDDKRMKIFGIMFVAFFIIMMTFVALVE